MKRPARSLRMGMRPTALAIRRTDVTRIEKNGLKISADLHDFIVDQALPGTGVEPDRFFEAFGTAVSELAPKNRQLLGKRDALHLADGKLRRAAGGLVR